MLAVITGASSGIGEVFARSLAARGYSLILIARRADRLQALAESLTPTPVECWEADLVDDADLERMALRLTDRNPDLLINNAGFGTLGLFHKTGLEGQLDMHRLHVLATVRLTHAVLPGMISRGTGGIVNVSSVAAFIAGPGNVSYCATKSWMNAFTEGLHVELLGLGSKVRVQALCPGYTRSEFHKTMGVSTGGIPEYLWLKAEDVVRASLEGLEQGKWLVVPDWKYKTLTVVQRLLPRRLIHALAGSSARKFRPDNFQG
jgi:uncharacterized protein